MSAPERMHVGIYRSCDNTVAYQNVPVHRTDIDRSDGRLVDSVIYVRADLHDTLRAENERLTRKVDDLEASLHDEETRVRHYSDRVTELEAAAQEALGCFEAAETEGLSDRLHTTGHTDPGSLYDLIMRRLLHAPVALRAALSEAQP